MDIGVHCKECGRLDFLPFTCPYCNAQLCLDHRNHGCRDESPPEPLPDDFTTHKKHVDRHSVPQTQRRLVSPPQTQSKGRPLGGKANPAIEKLRGLISGKGRSYRGNWKPSAHAELKKAAQGDASVPESARIYVYVERPAKSYKNSLTGKQEIRPAKKLPLFFDKSLKIGQVADRAASRLQAVAQGFEGLDSSESMLTVRQGAELLLKS